MRPIGITCGDPAGIGPEVTIKAARALSDQMPLIWFGDTELIPAGVEWRFVSDDLEAPLGPSLNVRPQTVFANRPVPGSPDFANATGVLAVLDHVTDLCLDGRLSGMCTGPISKKVLQDGARFDFPGHTEFLAAKAGVERVVMMLACDALRVVPLTIHIPIKDVSTAITPSLLTQTVQIIETALRSQFGVTKPRIAVAGLNPHASEGGNIGREDIDLIGPVISELRAQGFDITDPLPADTMFHAKARAGYDVTLCMYHDRALIPIKTIDFAGGVNVTLGLPFVRTSPDHGTAFDIAGKGIADPTSTINALRMAWDMVQHAA